MGSCSVRGGRTVFDIVLAVCLCCFVVVVFQSLQTIFLFPIYPDEIQIRIYLSRLMIDYPYRDTGAPPCASNLLQPFPFLMIIPGLLEYAFHGIIKNHVVLRLVGFFFFLGWLIPLSYYFLVQFACKSKDSFKDFLCKGIAFCCPWMVFFVGKLPFFLITNRAEQLILLSVLVLIFLVVYIDSKYFFGSTLQKSIVLLLYWLSGSMILFVHPKGLFLVPFIFFMLLTIVSRFKCFWLLLLFGASLVFQARQAIVSWSSVYKCIEFPKFELLLNTFSLSLNGIFTDFFGFLRGATNSFFEIYMYLNHLIFTNKVVPNYLPEIELTFVDNAANLFVAVVFAVVIIVNISFVVVLSLGMYSKHRKILTLNTGIVVLVLVVCAGAVFNVSKNWYDGGYFYSMMAIAFLFFCVNNFKQINRKIIIMLLIFFSGSMLSQVALVSNYLKPLENGYSGLGVSIASYDYGTIKDNVQAGLNSCGIVPGSQKIFVDDLTYLFVTEYKYPLPITYAGAIAEGDLDSFIASSGADGMIVRCDYMPQYAAFAQRHGEVCCLSKEALSSIPHAN